MNTPIKETKTLRRRARAAFLRAARWLAEPTQYDRGCCASLDYAFRDHFHELSEFTEIYFASLFKPRRLGRAYWWGVPWLYDKEAREARILALLFAAETLRP